MIHSISPAIAYNSETNEIFIINNEDISIRLSKQASRLLLVLVRNNGLILSRDYLINNVWESHGFSGSSISLNVAISEIRKAFRILGQEPTLIKTHRGKGFSLEYIENDTITAIAEIHDIQQKSDHPPKQKNTDVKQRIWYTQRNFLLLLVLLLALYICVSRNLN